MNASSNQRNTWRRLKKNKAALCGMAIIAVSLLIAVFAYFIAPDHSPDANRMILEIGGRKPGSSQLFLKIAKQGSEIHGSEPFWQRLLYGKKDRYDHIPINGYQLQKDTLFISKYIDEGLAEGLVYRIISITSPDNNNVSTDSLYSKPGLSGILEQKSEVAGGDSAELNAPANLTNASAAFSPYAFHIERFNYTLGSDKYGRDILSRLLIGVRVSLGVGLVTVLLSIFIGMLLGSLAGYFRGWVDDAIMWLVNVIWSIPTLLLVFAITLMLGKGFWQVFIAIGLTTWVNVARIVRGQVLSIREMQYVEAAKAMGFSSARIIARHVIPNVMGPVIVVAASNFASAIVIEAGLSFLGVGVQPPQPSWGLMVKENYNFIITHNPMLALAPGFAIMALVLAFNMLGSGLRDALQVKE